MTAKLTQKQLKILKMRYDGLKNKEIAAKLNVSEANISQIISNIVKKMDTIQDTLSVMQNLGLMENDETIELTKKGSDFSEAFRKKREMRMQQRMESLKSNQIISEDIGTVDISGFKHIERTFAKRQKKAYGQLGQNTKLILIERPFVSSQNVPYSQNREVIIVKPDEFPLQKNERYSNNRNDYTTIYI